MLNGLKIVVDCANGASYHIAPNVFRELGAEVITINDEPDGLNINLECGAMHPEQLRNRVLENKADLGVALDGDGDRVVMIDHKGHILDGDDLLYIIAKHRTMAGVFKGGIVGTVMSNIGFELAVRQLGLEFVRTPVGDRYIMSELREREWQLGGEPSGHIVCLATTTTGDGVITALQVLAAMRAQQLSLAEIRIGFEKYPQVLINVKCESRGDLESKPVQQAVKAVEKELGDKGRVLLRRSGTEPLVRIMVEGEDAAQVQKLAEHLADVIKTEFHG